jgi:PBSX family phage terminase large subunit
MNTKQANKQMIERELWIRGRLSWKMHAVQKEMYDIFNNSPARSILVWLLARQSGKSYMIVLMCLEMCLQNPGSLVALITDTKLHLEGIFEPLFQDILRDCPEDIKPEYHKNKFIFYFPNGSQIHLAGSDAGHAEKLRGKKFAVVFIDEAGFCSKLRYNIRSVILPTLTHTRGRIVMATTPPEDPEHEFVFFMERAELNGLLTKKTIYDNPLLKKEDIKSIEDELGVDSIDFKREYLCQIIRNESLMVVPEFDEVTEKALVQVVPKPNMFSGYVSMDLGYKDLSVVLFGYYNFELNKVVIEKEITVTGKKLIIPEFTQKILETERSLYTNFLTGEFIKPVRVSDINYLVTQEISRQSGHLLNFEAPRKDEKGVMVNFLRTMIKQQRVIINPECITLISHLRNAKWKNSSEKLEFARSADFAHFDAVDALIYLLRRVDFNKNPYPSSYNVNRKDLYVVNKDSLESNDTMTALKKLFAPKKRNR